MLKGKRIVLGITGGIAAYKCVELVRLLKKQEAEVQIILTSDASSFVSPKALGVVSGKPVLHSFWKDDESGLWNNHVELGIWADLLVMAPLTANTAAKMANGICDNLLLATYLSCRSKTLLCPAMDLDMWQHPATQRNFEILSQRHALCGPESGELASGLSGVGRMSEPQSIVAAIEEELAAASPLQGKTILITAGPTYEAIDPVRFIGNRSSGKMGFALAESCLEMGAQVVLITGPTHCHLNHANCVVVPVESASEMLQACQEHFARVDMAIMSAAVADYTPANPAQEKIKKKSDSLEIKLDKTQDILAWMGAEKDQQVVVGFALETSNGVQYAQDKLKRKKCDYIILNTLQDEGAGFAKDTNKVSIFDSEGCVFESDLKSKKVLAKDIVHFLVESL